MKFFWYSYDKMHIRSLINRQLNFESILFIENEKFEEMKFIFYFFINYSNGNNLFGLHFDFRFF